MPTAAETIVSEEQVLVIPTSKFETLGYFQGFSDNIDLYLPALFEGGDLAYRPRGKMELDASFKQLIPYVLFRYTDQRGGVNLFQYARGGGGGEKRLHAKRSVGVGGHISSDDAAAGKTEHVYREGMRRELEEEVAIDCRYTESCVGLLNDDETEVGKVHLGVVHLFDVEEPQVAAREDDILDARFRPVKEILDTLEEFETWSQIVVRALFG